jgi:dimeric dUTPase (all-alpha-NTP-PPase superfamily)
MRALFDLNVTNNFDLTFIEVSDFNRKAQQDSIMEHFK